MGNVNEEYNTYIKWILSDKKSVYKESRAGGTIANTGGTMKFDLSESFPIINTKKLFHRGVIHEMVWFMHGPEEDGELHIDYMLENKCNFWTKDLHNFNNIKKGITFPDVAEREKDFEVFKQKILNDAEFRKTYGSLGRPYGAQWRQWKIHGKDEYIDQLADAFEAVRAHSDSRRIIVEAWRPDETNNMALPSCHKDFQLVVMNERLDLDMVQRSADSFLGVPFNIMQYGLMCVLAGEYANLLPGVFTHHLVDAHIYCGIGKKAEWYKNNLNELKEKMRRAEAPEDYLVIKNWIDEKSDKEDNPLYEKFDHVTGVLEQLSRDTTKYPFASLEVKIDKNLPPKELLNTIRFDNFKVIGYKDNHYPAIEREMPTG